MNENEYERLESLINTAKSEFVMKGDEDTSLALVKALLSRDCNFLECFDKQFQKLQNNN